MPNVSLAALVGGSVVVKKSIVINSTQNWTAPLNLAGNTVWLTMSGGGGGGGWSANDSGNKFALGGFGGEFCEKSPIIVTAGTSYLVTIGSFGFGANTESAGGSGGATSFSTLLTVSGGSGGQQNGSLYPRVFDTQSMVGTHPLIPIYNGGTDPLSAIISEYKISGRLHGKSILTSGVNGYVITGGGCGYFGNGGDAIFEGGAGTINASANTGAGGGGRVTSGSEFSGTGGSGRVIIEWEEFL